MSLQTIRIPFSDNLLTRLGTDLLLVLQGEQPGNQEGDLSGGLVLLPSARACKTLGRILLEQSGRDTLLLPRILTVEQWAAEAALGLGKSTLGLPDDRVRPLLLAHGLTHGSPKGSSEGSPKGRSPVSWLAARPENAPALAAELLDFFDEVRRHRLDSTLFTADSLETVLALAGPQEAEIIASDLGKARQAWNIYREAVPEDRTDSISETAAALAANAAGGASAPGRTYNLVIAAGFARVDPVRADLLRAALASGKQSRLYLPEKESRLSRLSRLFLATWAPVQAGGAASSDPLDPSRRI